MITIPKPCSSCPWRVYKRAADIPNFDIALAERLSACCPDKNGMGPEFGASIFACHLSKDGAEIACAGWLGTVGHKHPGMRLSVCAGHIDASALSSADGWPELHENYQDVLEKLRATCW